MKTIKQTVDDLNKISEVYQPDEFLAIFKYLTDRKKNDYITNIQLLNAYLCQTFGKIFRKLDPVAFNASRSFKLKDLKKWQQQN